MKTTMTAVAVAVAVVLVSSGCPDKAKDKYAKVKKVLFHKDKAGKVSPTKVKEQLDTIPAAELCGLYSVTMEKCREEVNALFDSLRRDVADIDGAPQLMTKIQKLYFQDGVDSRRKSCRKLANVLGRPPVSCLGAWKAFTEAKTFSCGEYTKCIRILTAQILQQGFDRGE